MEPIGDPNPILKFHTPTPSGKSHKIQTNSDSKTLDLIPRHLSVCGSIMEPAAGTGLLPYNFFLSPSPSWNLPELLWLSGSARTVSVEGSNIHEYTHVRCVLSVSGDAMGDTWLCSAFFRAFLGLSPLLPWVCSSGEEIGENRGGSWVSSSALSLYRCKTPRRVRASGAFLCFAVA